jgi:hypothetical protein
MVGDCGEGETLSRPQTAIINNNDNISNKQRDKDTMKKNETTQICSQKPTIFHQTVNEMPISEEASNKPNSGWIWK